MPAFFVLIPCETFPANMPITAVHPQGRFLSYSRQIPPFRRLHIHSDTYLPDPAHLRSRHAGSEQILPVLMRKYNYRRSHNPHGATNISDSRQLRSARYRRMPGRIPPRYRLRQCHRALPYHNRYRCCIHCPALSGAGGSPDKVRCAAPRSEERRVGKECL